MANALMIYRTDNVVVATKEIKAHDQVVFKCNGGEKAITVNDTIPIYHKVAISDIAEGEAIIKYGHPIGIALKNIRTGDYVHCHNVESPSEKEV